MTSAPKPNWRCRNCGRGMVFDGEPKFCPHCRSERLRPVATEVASTPAYPHNPDLDWY